MLLPIKRAVELLPVGQIVIDRESPSGLRGRRRSRCEVVGIESCSRSVWSGNEGKKTLRIFAKAGCGDFVLKPLLSRHRRRTVIQAARRSHETARNKDRVREGAEVASDHRLGGNRLCLGCTGIQLILLHAQVEESLVFSVVNLRQVHRPAKRKAVVIFAVDGSR